MNIGIVGAGTIGADLAYLFAGRIAKTGGKVVLLDISEERLDAAYQRVGGYAKKAVAKGKLAPQAAAGMLKAITTTLDMVELATCDVVIEAASENLDVKQGIHRTIAATVRDDCMVCTTTSSIPRAVLAEEMAHPERFFVWHPFTPAWRSPVVELVGNRQHPCWRKMHDLTVAMGKVPIVVADTPCFAGNDIFIAYCVEAARLVMDGVGTVAQVNAVANKHVGGSGAFNVLNITAANAIADFCCQMMRQKHGDWWVTPQLLIEQGTQPWDLSGDTSCSEETERTIRDRLMAVIVGRAIWLVDNNVVSPTDLDWLCKNALGFKFGPVARFNHAPDEFKDICAAYARNNLHFTVPNSIANATPVDFLSNVKVEIDDDGIAVVPIFRPEAMNALNRQTMVELDYAFRVLEADGNVKGIVLTGFSGAIAGADINELAALTDPYQGIALATAGQAVLHYIEDLNKPVIAVVNGPCLGGGCELAMACHARVVGPNAIVGQPEVNLGIIPGYGGTQRLPRLVGFETALELLRTGKPMDTKEAIATGWAQFADANDPVARAKGILLTHLADKIPSIRPVNPDQMEVPDETPAMDIGHHSLVIDAILVDVVRTGLALPLVEGLQLEADGFGRCLKTQDTRIGLSNFMANGPKVPAVFVNA
ncbi:MAG: enoyl-CoA hydratase/isomerase family protein [Candidatus Magasanikbacteria bacterium]|nr:enoyl-CoA hydratase/isomerase family protein [Candidatus Magasanikbacteria bacterium]